MYRKRIVIVGNGTSLLDRKNGSLIDDFECVVRFNSYKIKGYEDHVGTKTNIWFTVNKAHIDEIQDYDRVITHSWINHDICDVYADLLSKRYVSKLSKSFIQSFPLGNPSTGLLAIYYLLNEYEYVYITGFDWWERDEHHYGDNEERGSLHDPKKEKDLIDRLVADNKVKFL
jgi:hypothetical protein